MTKLNGNLRMGKSSEPIAICVHNAHFSKPYSLRTVLRPPSKMILICFVLKGSEIVWSVHIWAIKPAKRAQTLEEDQV